MKACLQKYNLITMACIVFADFYDNIIYYACLYNMYDKLQAVTVDLYNNI